jgi:dipeptidyl aminopeptidase/acylaminoacyl peptidase
MKEKNMRTIDAAWLALAIIVYGSMGTQSGFGADAPKDILGVVQADKVIATKEIVLEGDLPKVAIDSTFVIDLSKKLPAKRGRGVVFVDREVVDKSLLEDGQKVLERKECNLSPDGENLLFTSRYTAKNPYPYVFSLNLKAKVITQLTFEGTSAMPVWSPDGTLFVFYLSNIKFADLSSKDGFVLVQVEWKTGGELTELTKPSKPTQWSASRTHPPVFSPDGSKIFFEANMEEGAAVSSYIYVIDLKGRTIKKVAQGANPQLSPDGKRLIYQDRGLFELNLENRETRTLFGLEEVDKLGVPTRHTLSPSGKNLAFEISGEIYIMSVDSKKRSKLDGIKSQNFFWLLSR